MSKLSKLKQEAFLAAKKRDWDNAVSVYERILDLDKNNPTLINELGDICLKKGDLSRAINHFLAAAAKYRNTGLLNNAVAIYKKILRHEPENLNAHWYLAEIRAGQGLTVEGEKHALAFLSSSENIASEIKEIFLKRCIQLFALYQQSSEILERLQGVFRLWSMTLEESRVTCLLACVAFDEGRQEEAELSVGAALEKAPEVANYPEYVTWCKHAHPNEEIGHPGDVNELSLGGAGAGSSSDDFVNFSLGEEREASPAGTETTFADLDGDNAGSAPASGDTHAAAGMDAPSFEDLMGGVSGSSTEQPPTGLPPAAGDEGRIEIDDDSGSSLNDVLDEVESVLPADAGKETTGAGGPTGMEDFGSQESGSVDLLAEILAEDGTGIGSDDAGQVDTIASEIGQVVGGESAPDDAKSQYDMGLVYLEMGLFDQACECFSSSAADPEFVLRSYEMWGITLRRQGMPEEAIAVLTRGLQAPADDLQEQLGLIYHTGRSHEDAGRADEARQWYERAYAIAPDFRDIQQRLTAQSLS